MKIKTLKIYSQHIQSQVKFYRDELGFEIKNYSEKSFEVICGYSLLKFEYRENSKPYHIAFHIPDSQEEEAMNWLEKLLPVLGYNDEKIIDFSNWGAKSVYFYDAEENIIEFISRRDFSKPESAIFDPQQIVGIAEIGLATTNVKPVFEKLKLDCELNKYDGDLEKFCAVGEDSGLIIVIDKNKKNWFPTGDKAFTTDFILEFTHKNKDFRVSFEDDQIQIENI